MIMNGLQKEREKSTSGIPVVMLPRKEQIKYLKRCLQVKVRSDDDIILGKMKKIYSFISKEESNKFFARVLKKLRPAILTQQLEKAEEDKLKMEESLTYSRTRVQAYGEGFALGNVPDEQLKAIGMMIGVAMRRWKTETAKREAEKQLNANEHLRCPITCAPFSDPVIASDGHTYERYAIENWISENNSSPITRQPISILRGNDDLKSVVESTRELLEKHIYEKCKLPKLE